MEGTYYVALKSSASRPIPMMPNLKTPREALSTLQGLIDQSPILTASVGRTFVSGDHLVIYVNSEGAKGAIEKLLAMVRAPGTNEVHVDSKVARAPDEEEQGRMMEEEFHGT